MVDILPSVSSCFFKKQQILWRQPVILAVGGVDLSVFTLSRFYLLVSETLRPLLGYLLIPIVEVTKVR